MNITHATEPISPLRKRFIEDMYMRKLSTKTQSQYILAIKRFSKFLGCSPLKANEEDLRLFQLHLVKSGLGRPTINCTNTALKFLFNITLNRFDITRKLSRLPVPTTLPIVLTPDEVVSVINAASTFKYKAMLSVAYGAGLRAQEVCQLRVMDVDSENMVLHVEQGKGGRDRQAMLSPQLLNILRHWWCIGQKQHKMLKRWLALSWSKPCEPTWYTPVK